MVVGGLLIGVVSVIISRRMQLRLVQFWHKGVVSIVGVNCQIEGEVSDSVCFYVSNHISWLDISIIGSRLPVVFLAKSEISKWPVLGLMIKNVGTIFIQRGKGANAAVKEISNVLEQQQSVLVFPEGKTTDGSSVYRFQPRLFQSAKDCGVPVQPVGLKYVNENGGQVVRLAFLGETSFMQSIWRSVCGEKMFAKIKVFNPINPDKSRDLLSQDAENCIRQWIE